MTSNMRAQRLIILRNRYDHLQKQFAALPQLDGASEQFLAESEGRLDALGEAVATLAQIPDIQPTRRIVPVVEAAREQLIKVRDAYRARLQDAVCAADAWRARGALPTLSFVISEIEAVLPRARRSSSLSLRWERSSRLAYRRIRWVASPVPCVLCHLPSLALLPDELGGQALCHEHLSPLLTGAAARKIEQRLDALLENRLTLRGVFPLSAEALHQDMEALQRYYTARWLLAEHREKDAHVYYRQPNAQDDQQSSLSLFLSTPEDGLPTITMEVPPTITHRLVLLDLAQVLAQSNWMEKGQQDAAGLTAA